MFSRNYLFVYTLFLAVTVLSCKKLLPKAPEEFALLDGPVEGLTPDQTELFIEGDIAFNDQVFTKETGLGPLFNATSCGSCHAGDGKGHPFTSLIRFGQSDVTGNQFLQFGGPQLQHLALPGYQPEKIPVGATHTKLLPPANTGLGFLSALTDAQILAFVDEFDANGDGISGVPNYIDAPDFFLPSWIHQAINGKYIGRFGKKASAIDLLHQTVNAYNQDMGITSSFRPIDTYSGLKIQPEVSDKDINAVVFYLKTLKAPVQRTKDNSEVREGGQLFETLQCVKCHIPRWKTPVNAIAALSEKTFAPYTDLLLHDMGEGLNDNYTEGTATTREWRTPPLWGLGLAKDSQGGSYFLLHDGRAHSIEAAILLHGGEATKSKEAFQNASDAQKAKVIRFLESL